jgi:small subunit ribosomal protein S13
MARIVGVDVPNEKVVWVALTYIHGIGKKSAFDILYAVGVNPARRLKDLTDEELAHLTTEIEKNYVVEGNLRRQVQQNISRLKEIASYRGIRHRRGLPVRGQRTRTNARTRKGPRKTVAGKKSVKELR